MRHFRAHIREPRKTDMKPITVAYGMKQIDTGGLPFAEIRSCDKYYVDKTGLIRDLLNYNDRGIYLFTRPRRFGKTTNISMLDAFFNMKYKGNTWFDGLEISDCLEYESYKNAFPVIHVDLGCAKAGTYSSFLSGIRFAVNSAFREHIYLRNSPNVPESLRSLFVTLDSNTTPEDLMITSLNVLSSAVAEYHGRNPVILIDEYDRAVSDSFGTETHDRMMDFLSRFMYSTIKGNPCRQMVYVTGVMQVAKANMFSGLNNVDINNIFSQMGDERFGFTEDEVTAILTEYGHPEKITEAREWYDGYRFGDAEVYNPFSIMNYVFKGFKPAAYWAASAENTVINYLLEDLGNDDYDSILSLVAGKETQIELDQTFTFDTVAKSGKPLFSLMAMAGYLKAVPRGGSRFDISIPNTEVRGILRDIMRTIYPVSDSVFGIIDRSLLNRDADALTSALQKIMKNSSYMHLDEYTYQAVVMILMSGLSDKYDISLESESGIGRIDILLGSKNETRPNVIIEIKKVEKERDLDAGVDKAIAQIHERKYYLGMPGEVTLLGLAFWKKIPKARFECVFNNRDGLKSIPASDCRPNQG